MSPLRTESVTQDDQTAPELRLQKWIDANGQPLDHPLTLTDLGFGLKFLFAFQDWCPGCPADGDVAGAA